VNTRRLNDVRVRATATCERLIGGTAAAAAAAAAAASAADVAAAAYTARCAAPNDALAIVSAG